MTNALEYQGPNSKGWQKTSWRAAGTALRCRWSIRADQTRSSVMSAKRRVRVYGPYLTLLPG